MPTLSQVIQDKIKEFEKVFNTCDNNRPDFLCEICSLRKQFLQQAMLEIARAMVVEELGEDMITNRDGWNTNRRQQLSKITQVEQELGVKGKE